MTTLKNILIINALSSGVTGLGLIVVPNLFARLFGLLKHRPFLEWVFFSRLLPSWYF